MGFSKVRFDEIREDAVATKLNKTDKAAGFSKMLLADYSVAYYIII